MSDKEFIEGYGDRGPLNPGAPAGSIEGVPPGQITVEPYVPPVKNPENPQQPSFFQRFQKSVGEDLKTGIKQKLLEAGWPESEAETRAASITARIPQTPAGIGRSLLLPILAGLMPAGRTPGRIAGQFLTHVGGSAGLEAGEAGLTGQPILPALGTGALKGIPGGTVQATLGGILGPNRATIQATRASEQARLGEIFSPPVRAVIPEDPQALFSQKTLERMVKTAGVSLNNMEKVIFTALEAKSPVRADRFKVLREQIKVLRDVGETTRMNPEMRVAARRADQEAAQLEGDLLTLVQQSGSPDLAKIYQTTIRDYAQDRAQIRVLKAIQRTQRLPGGANPVDNPETAEFVEAIRSPALSAAARATLMSTLVALRHPFMALHFAQSGRGEMFVDPTKIRPPFGGKATGPLGVLGGGTASLLAPQNLPTPDEP